MSVKSLRKHGQCAKYNTSIVEYYSAMVDEVFPQKKKTFTLKVSRYDKTTFTRNYTGAVIMAL